MAKCTLFLIKEEHSSLQVESFQNSNAPYLGNPMENFNYLNFLPENSRRLKALPAWFSLRAYGKEGYKNIVENAIDLAKYFGSKIKESENFKLLAPVRLNNIVFNINNNRNKENIDSFLTQLNKTGKVFMTPTLYNDQKGIRVSFVNWRTTKNDIELVLKEMNRIINIIE